MRALALLGGLVGGCAPPPAALSGPPTHLEDCAPYEVQGEVYAYCVGRVAAVTRDPTLVGLTCAAAGDAAGGEAACRRAWVEARVQEGSAELVESMLAMCAGMPDCALLVMDNFPLPDVVAQLGRCEVYAGPYLDHCASHALDTWAARRPTEAEVLAVGVAAVAWPQAYGESVGVLRYCEGRRLPGRGDDPAGVGCPEGGPAAEACVRALRDLERNDGRRIGPTGPQSLCPPLGAPPARGSSPGPPRGEAPAAGRAR